ncbi:MAG TPA: ATP-dependent RecD-like DNA helicase [Planctomycetota bacterium]|nr:ATP-dependent RecD-like DNA helicase [Planctomycetota bacterium]
MAESISGVIERVTFHNEENGFCVLRVKAKGVRELATVIGHAPSVNAGEFLDAVGEWVVDRDHGRQFRCAQLRVAAPSTPEGIEKYLGSGVIKGIGPLFAHRLVERFGERVFDVIESEPARLREVDGIGPGRQSKISAGWTDQKEIRRIMVFLTSHGVGTARAVRIYKTYGARAVDKVRENPYALAHDIHGIGFQTADQIARALGVDPKADIRAQAGLGWALQEHAAQGHVCFPQGALIESAVKLLDIPEDILRRALDGEIACGRLVRDTVRGMEVVYLAALHRAETAVAESLRALREGPPALPVLDVDDAIGKAEADIGLTLAPSQRAALRVALGSKVLVVTGGPGVGKTTLVNSLLKILHAGLRKVLLAAPTGRAARRLAETTGWEAKTLHRLLEVDASTGQFKRTRDNPLEADVVVLDEASMVDVVLMHQLLRAIPARTSLVLVGDVDQLPSVGPGTVLRDIIDSGAVPVVRLTEVFRQAAASRIITNAHRINAGWMPEPPRSAALEDFYFVEAQEPADIVERILRLLTERIPERFGLDPVRDVQVLTPMNRSELGARALNERLQAVLNPPGPPEVSKFGTVFRQGDKVMQVHNDYDKEVFNGDVGFLRRIDPEEREAVVDFDGREVVYDLGELDELAPAYACSIHKSQGSEYPAVVIPLHTQHYRMLHRHVLYTGVTRGKKLVVLVGSKKALSLAVRRTEENLRLSGLRERLNPSPSA